jgi:DNA oxidative demethylase
VSEVRNALEIRGFKILKSFLDRDAQQRLLSVLRPVLHAAPLFSPDNPYGRKMSVRMTSAGAVGWFSDRAGYRYVDRHPGGAVWPDIPRDVLDIWDRVTGLDRRPDSCLINYYAEGAKMALHRDCDEADFSWPVVSVSLGDDGLFRIGNTTRGGKTGSVWLGSGDVVVMGGAARLAYHGVDKIRFGSSGLLSKGGRINLTLRVTT